MGIALAILGSGDDFEIGPKAIQQLTRYPSFALSESLRGSGLAEIFCAFFKPRAPGPPAVGREIISKMENRKRE